MSRLARASRSPQRNAQGTDRTGQTVGSLKLGPGIECAHRRQTGDRDDATDRGHARIPIWLNITGFLQEKRRKMQWLQGTRTPYWSCCSSLAGMIISTQ